MMRKLLPGDLELSSNDCSWLYVSNGITIIQRGVKLKICSANDTSFDSSLHVPFISSENAIKKDQPT